MTSGHDTLRRWAPEAAAALDAVVGALWADAAASGTVDLVAEVAASSGGLLSLDALAPPTPPDPDGQGAPAWAGDRPAVLAFTGQCCLDVAALDVGTRAAFLAATGPSAGAIAAAAWVADFVPRTRAALDALFGSGAWPRPEAVPAPGGLWGALDGLIRVVPALDALDPVTSELIRLRGARQHDCRLCRSLRARSALRAGATDRDFVAVDHYATSDLSPLARAALALTDAMIWAPGRIGPNVVTDLKAVATDAQQVEIVLDVTRNALNKVAVALGADAAHVEEGVEIYDVEPDGSLVYGLAPD